MEPPLVALAEDLEEEFRAGGGQGDEAQFVDDQQVELGQIPLQVEQPSLIPGIQRSALPRFHRRDAPAGGPGWKQPCLRPRLGIPPCRSSGGGWKTRFISPWQDGILRWYPKTRQVAKRESPAPKITAPLVALAEDLEEEFRAGGGQGDEAQFVDDQQVELGQIPLQVEQPSLIPGIQRSALPRFHRRDAPAGGPGWKQPCLRPRLGIPPCRSSGGGWKTRFISPWQDGILLPIPARGAAG